MADLLNKLKTTNLDPYFKKAQCGAFSAQEVQFNWLNLQKWYVLFTILSFRVQTSHFKWHS